MQINAKILQCENGFLILLYLNVFTIAIQIRSQTQKYAFWLHKLLIQKEMRKTDHQPEADGYDYPQFLAYLSLEILFYYE